ncbi:MAG: hypothetical protein LQ351_000224 [Letrouitia transgressa]|nr:MAG: hypothetical protein LQ351_000224 [Letrouitia transgressa]
MRILQAANGMNSPTACLSPCSDSALSTTANILSILTFALGLFASYVALISATRGAPAEIKRLVEDLRTTQHEINRVAEYIFDDAHDTARLKRRMTDGGAHRHTHAHFNPYTSLVAGKTLAVGGVLSYKGEGTGMGNDMLYLEVQNLLKTCITLFYEADDLLKRSEREQYGLRRRILFVMNRNDLAEKLARLADQKAKLAAIQMSLFLKKSTLQDAMLEQIVAFTEELQISRTKDNEKSKHLRPGIIDDIY